MRPGFRPPTDAEYHDDYAKRVAAIERAEAEGTHSPRQIKDAHEVLLTFRGYPRPVEEVGPCTEERPFGPCTQRCEQPTGHDGPHRSQCFAWCNPHDIATDIANLWSGPKDLWNTAEGGQIIGQIVTRYCRACPWMEEHMCAFGEDGDCDHTEGWTEK
jgi:hypothetical protein